jgi:hypothetical protein
VQIDGGTLTRNGLGLRQATVLHVNVYVATLYVAKVSEVAVYKVGDKDVASRSNACGVANDESETGKP